MSKVKMNYGVLAITGKSERLIFQAIDKKAACDMSMGKNKRPYNIIYIVIEPSGNRLTITNQRKYLKIFEE